MKKIMKHDDISWPDCISFNIVFIAVRIISSIKLKWSITLRGYINEFISVTIRRDSFNISKIFTMEPSTNWNPWNNKTTFPKPLIVLHPTGISLGYVSCPSLMDKLLSAYSEVNPYGFLFQFGFNMFKLSFLFSSFIIISEFQLGKSKFTLPFCTITMTCVISIWIKSQRDKQSTFKTS